MYKIKDQVKKSSDIQRILGEKFENQEKKVIDHIDELCASWIKRSPFVAIASVNSYGQVDIAPKGDPAGFVVILDKKTLAIPDRIGNHRGDTFYNIIDNPRIGLMFVVPNRNEVVRVSGSASIVKDENVLNMMIVKNHKPDLAIIVHVEEAMYHCGKSMIRSKMWKPDEWAPVEGLPSYALAIKTHAQMPEPIETYEEMMKNNEENRLY